MTDRLAQTILGDDIDEPQRGRPAVVTSVTPLEVSILGQAGLPASRLGSYALPAAPGDTVWVTQTGTFILVHHKIVSGG